MTTAQREEDGSTVTGNASMFRRVELPPEPPDDVPTTDDASSGTVTRNTCGSPSTFQTCVTSVEKGVGGSLPCLTQVICHTLRVN